VVITSSHSQRFSASIRLLFDKCSSHTVQFATGHIFAVGDILVLPLPSVPQTHTHTHCSGHILIHFLCVRLHLFQACCITLPPTSPLPFTLLSSANEIVSIYVERVHCVIISCAYVQILSLHFFSRHFVITILFLESHASHGVRVSLVTFRAAFGSLCKLRKGS